jgi:hypothetical protein
MTAQSLDDLLSRVLQQAESAIEQQGGGAASPTGLGLTEPVEGRGTAWDERIAITIGDGRVTGCTLQPQVMRVSSLELSEHLIEAFNLALTDYQAALMAALAEQQPDLTAISSSVREIQSDAVRAVSAYTDQMHDVLRRVNDR